MKKMILALALTVFALGTFQAKAQTGDEYQQVLHTYMVNTGSLSSLEPMIDQMMLMMGGSLTDAQKGEIRTRSIDTLMELMAPEYQKLIAMEDLKALNDFYLTPAGKRIAEATPKLTQAAMGAGQAWAGKVQQIMQDVMTK